MSGQLLDTAATTAGQITLAGVAVCLFGIALSGRAGVEKEREMSAEQKQATVREFNFWKGLVVAIFAGVMSASMSYGLAAGKPIGELAVERGVPPLWQNLPVLVVVLFGGFCTNLVWCLLLIGRNRTAAHYVSLSDKSGAGWLVLNYVLCAVAGVTWYLQFFFYSMGTTKMGPYDFSSWTLHMAFIIFFSTLWGIALREWKGTSRAVHVWIALGLAVLVLSTVIIGYGNSLAVSAGGIENAVMDAAEWSREPIGTEWRKRSHSGRDTLRRRLPSWSRSARGTYHGLTLRIATMIRSVLRSRSYGCWR